MSTITSDWNLGAAGDDVYAAIVEAHQGLSDEASRRLDVRLILLLANHIGAVDVLREALAAARQNPSDR